MGVGENETARRPLVSSVCSCVILITPTSTRWRLWCHLSVRVSMSVQNSVQNGVVCLWDILCLAGSAMSVQNSDILCLSDSAMSVQNCVPTLLFYAPIRRPRPHIIARRPRHRQSRGGGSHPSPRMSRRLPIQHAAARARPRHLSSPRGRIRGRRRHCRSRRKRTRHCPLRRLRHRAGKLGALGGQTGGLPG